MAKLYDATDKWLKEQGIGRRDAQRLFTALCTLADYEGLIVRTMERCCRGSHRDHSDVCHALRKIVDGDGE